MLELIISSLYFILPAYFANMSPVITGRLRLPLGHPINSRVFGSHKTYRGFYSGYIGALLILVGQFYLQKEGLFSDYNLLDYRNINLFFYAFLFGIGAVTGDLIKSFFKRRLGKKPGSSWFPFDQLDFIVVAIIFLLPVYMLPWKNILTIIIATPILHFLTNIAAYKLKMKKVWW